MAKWDDLEVNKKFFRSPKNSISIRKNGDIYFGTSFFDEKMDKNKYVKLFYSEKNKAIVFDFIKKKFDNNAIKLINTTGCRAKIISGRVFFKIFGLNPKNIQGSYEVFLENILDLGKKWVLYLK